MAGEEIAAAHADGRPQRDSMRIDRIAQFRYKTPDLRCKASPAFWFFSGSTG
jgi:hypothetical protein